MRKKITIALTVVGFLVCAVLVPFTSADWTMFHSDPSHSGTQTNTSTTMLSWKYTSTSWFESSAAVVNGIVYIGCGDCRVYALNASNGLQLWNFTTRTSIFSSPAVINDAVYIGSGDGTFYALNATTGIKLWNYVTHYGFLSSATVVDNVVYVGSMDNNVLALNSVTGYLIWNYTTGNSVASSPAVVNNVVYVASDDHNIYALNATDGNKLWNYTTGGMITSSPAVVGGVLYIGSNDHAIYALNSSTGVKLWTYVTGDCVFSSPAIVNNVVYVGSADHSLYALSADTGAVIWSFKTGNQVYSSPAVVNNVVYVGSWDHQVYAFDATSGSKLWSYATGYDIHSSPAVIGDVVYIGSDGNSVYALNANSLSSLPTPTPSPTPKPSPTPVVTPVPVYASQMVENSWHLKAPMKFSRANLGVAAVDGIIYAIGGDEGADIANCDFGNSMTNQVVNSTEAYDPTSNVWVTKAAMPTSRALFGTAVCQNKIYCIGGYNGAVIFVGPQSYNWKTEYYTLSTNEVYDPISNSWVTKAPMPYPRLSAATNIVNGKIYVMGGSTIEGSAITNNKTQVYDPQTDKWTFKSAAPLPVVGSSSGVIDNKIYVLGYKAPKQYVIETYDPANDNWTVGYATTSDSYVTGATTTGLNSLKRMYFFDENETVIYDPATDKWTTGTPAPVDRLIAKVAVINDAFYLIGGRTGQWGYITMEFPTTLNEQYLPIGYGSPDTISLPTNIKPKISILKPTEQTYKTSNISLTFTVDKATTWISYSLDGNPSAIINGNISLTGLANRNHTLTIYANDTSGNIGPSETISFTTAKPEPESFPVVPVAAVSAVAVALMVAGLLVYHKKHKRRIEH